MALSIKRAEADALARELARLTGEARGSRERIRREPDGRLPERVATLAERLRADYDTRPVSQSEWDAAAGDTT